MKWMHNPIAPPNLVMALLLGLPLDGILSFLQLKTRIIIIQWLFNAISLSIRNRWNFNVVFATSVQRTASPKQAYRSNF